MKAIQFALIAAGLVAGSSVFAATALPPGTQSVATKYNYDANATTPKYVVSNFDFMASAYVIMKVDESEHAIAVGTTSLRGLKNVFTGSSEGGAVTVCGAPVGSGASYTATEATTALGATNGVDVTKVAGCKSNAGVNAASTSTSTGG